MSVVPFRLRAPLKSNENNDLGGLGALVGRLFCRVGIIRVALRAFMMPGDTMSRSLCPRVALTGLPRNGDWRGWGGRSNRLDERMLGGISAGDAAELVIDAWHCKKSVRQ